MPKPLLEGRHLSKTFGRQEVLHDLSFQIGEGEKVALIGRNGAGKSTLLRVLMGEVEADAGEVHFFASARLGVIRQQEVLPGNVSTLAYLEQESGKPEWEVRKMGSKFGLHTSELEQIPSELSGGYQMRVKLTAMFLKDPNLLFLDEPVNYLDLQTLLLLESVLASYRGACIVVAHDRTFLQNACDSTWEIERAKLTTYKGRVQEYLEWKRGQAELAKRHNKRLAREIRHNQVFVDRFRYKASLATRAQNKLKHIARLRSQVVKIDADLATTRMRIPSPKEHGGSALRVEDLRIGYGDRVIAEDIRFEFARGEKIVIAGENGRGKSTLLKTLVGRIEPLGGKMKWWKHANVGYYDQLTSDALNDRDTVLSHLTSSAPAGTSAEGILMMAGNFLFQGDDLDKRVTVLSGGERARLALAGVLLGGYSVLVLDEPTNHLDVETSEALAVALKAYKGTVIFVSHARTFVMELADRIFEVRDQRVRQFMGDYVTYVDQLVEAAYEDAREEREAGKQEDDDARRERREARQRAREMNREVRRIEKQMDVLEKEKSEILKFFFENPLDYDPPKQQRLDELKASLEKLEREWIKCHERMEEVG